MRQDRQGANSKPENRMEHRHLDLEPDQWGVAAVESIWERGSDADIVALLRECKKDPSSAAARAVRKAIPQSKTYGFPKMFALFLKRLEENP